MVKPRPKVLQQCQYCPNVVERTYRTLRTTCFDCKLLQKAFHSNKQVQKNRQMRKSNNG
jgi:hypothetical protein